MGKPLFLCAVYAPATAGLVIFFNRRSLFRTDAAVTDVIPVGLAGVPPVTNN